MMASLVPRIGCLPATQLTRRLYMSTLASIPDTMDILTPLSIMTIEPAKAKLMQITRQTKMTKITTATYYYMTTTITITMAATTTTTTVKTTRIHCLASLVLLGVISCLISNSSWF
jgi:hypothetical protein